jgi:hypothetical protein
MLTVAFGHMPGLGGHARAELARMGGDQLLMEVELHKRVADMHLKAFTDVLMGHRVVVVLVVDVVVDVDLDCLDVDVAIGLAR